MLVMRCGFAALFFFVVASAAVSVDDRLPVMVTGLRTEGPDLEVLLSSFPPGGADVVLVDSSGAPIASVPAISTDCGVFRARLAGALAAFAGRGPAYRIVVSAKGGAASVSFPFFVALRCPEGETGTPCRFHLLPGLSAPGAALVHPDLGRVLDALPSGTEDLLATAVAHDPSLRGAALTAAWSWASLPPSPPGTCGCFWTLEAALPGGTLDGGAAVGIVAREAEGEEAVRFEQARRNSLSLRQRCVRAKRGAAEKVVVANGAWSTTVAIPRVVLSACSPLCAPTVSWSAELEGRALAWAEGGEDAAAAASWKAELTVDGVSPLGLEDSTSSAAGVAGGEAVRRAEWSGAGVTVDLQAAASAEVAAPNGPTDAEAVAAVAWRLVGKGASACAAPARVGISASSQSRMQEWTKDPVFVPIYEPGQIGLLTGGGDCPP